MRLAYLLMPAVLWGQGSGETVPWHGVSFQAPPPAPLPGTSGGPLRVQVDPDGSIKVFDAKGLRLMRGGLPGRPGKLWRDGGSPIAASGGTFDFPDQTLLGRGPAAWPLAQPDFRPALEGLLWILEEGGETLTLLHPARNQMLHVRLPDAEGLELHFYPDRLEAVAPGRGQRWALPWRALLPQWLRLSRPGPSLPVGTASVPFPG